jgi:integrase/recombinase XerD
MVTTKRRQGHAADLTDRAVTTALAQAKAAGRLSERNTALIRISLGLGLRAGEIAALRWSYVLSEDGTVGKSLDLPNDVAKWGSGRRGMPLSPPVREALEELRKATAQRVGVKPEDPIFLSQKGGKGLTRQAVVDLFRRIWSNAGISASSHSGRRYFITKAARSVSSVGGSLNDVRQLARHKHLATTQRYIAENTKAQSDLVNVIGRALKA